LASENQNPWAIVPCCFHDPRYSSGLLQTDGRTDRHRATTYTALAWHREVKLTNSVIDGLSSYRHENRHCFTQQLMLVWLRACAQRHSSAIKQCNF